ncbi:MAG: DUF1552 domain-containing protein [Myxococcales bacterium]|nr:DUF1552 domain-containing protein [Myxococcales bacterium]
MRRPLSRRAMLKAGLGASALSLFPFLDEAKAETAPRRLLLFYTPHGTIWDQWRPTGSETNFTLSPILAPLASHKSRLAIVDGIRLETGTSYYVPHTYTMPLLWTGSPIDTNASDFCRPDHGVCFGWNTGVSVDQFIAGQLQEQTPYNTLELGFGCGGLHPATRMIYSGPAMPRSPLDSPNAAFDALFGAIDPNIEQAQKDAVRRSSVLDTVLADFNGRRAVLSPEDKARLDAHADALRELELSLTATGCEAPLEPMGVDAQNGIDHQSRLLAAALGCGLSRVASFQLRIADNDNTLYPWVGLETGGHHTSTHDSSPASQAVLTALYTWYAERFAYLLDQLANTPDVDGRSVLDNTLVIWGSELGIGWTHDISNVPFVFAGATDLLAGGRYLSGSVIQQGRMLVSACHAMGLTEVQSYGSLDTGAGPIPGLFV